MNSRVRALECVSRVGSVYDMLGDDEHNGYVVVDKKEPRLGRLQGIILRSQLIMLLRKRVSMGRGRCCCCGCAPCVWFCWDSLYSIQAFYANPDDPSSLVSGSKPVTLASFTYTPRGSAYLTNISWSIIYFSIFTLSLFFQSANNKYVIQPYQTMTVIVGWTSVRILTRPPIECHWMPVWTACTSCSGDSDSDTWSSLIRITRWMMDSFRLLIRLSYAVACGWVFFVRKTFATLRWVYKRWWYMLVVGICQIKNWNCSLETVYKFKFAGGRYRHPKRHCQIPRSATWDGLPGEGNIYLIVIEYKWRICIIIPTILMISSCDFNENTVIIINEMCFLFVYVLFWMTSYFVNILFWMLTFQVDTNWAFINIVLPTVFGHKNTSSVSNRRFSSESDNLTYVLLHCRYCHTL